MSAGRKLRDAMASKKYIFTPGITTPLHAMIVEKIGFDFVYCGGYDVSLAGMRTSMQSMWDYAVNFKSRGAQAEIDFQKRLAQHPMGQYHEMAGFAAMKALEEKYLPAKDVKKKYDGTVGL